MISTFIDDLGSFVRSVTMDSWSEKQLNMMKVSSECDVCVEIGWRERALS